MDQEELANFMASLSDKELDKYLINHKNFSSSEIEAALVELQKRGKSFTDFQLQYFQNVIHRKQIEEDPNSPVYYSKMGIWWFSILFSVLFGAILLSFNLKDRREKWVVIGFGITYLVFMFTVLDRVGSSSVTTTSFILNAIGGVVLQTYFWNKYIGLRTPYKSKSILIPILIGLAISVPLLILSLYIPKV